MITLVTCIHGSRKPCCAARFERYFDFSNLYFHARVIVLSNYTNSCSVTFSVDIAPSLYKNYVVVILYALIREGSFRKRKICYRF
jgi:hypothetical protein